MGQKRRKKGKNKIVDYEYRLKVVKLYEAHGMPTVLDTLYSTLGPTQRESTRKKIYGWIAAKNHIVAKARSPRTSHQKCVRAIGTGTTLPANIEEQLAQWIHGMRRDGVPVTYGMLRIMAVEMATDAAIKDHEFKASTRWVQGFRRRHRFAWRVKTRIGQVSNDDGDEKLKQLSKKIREMMQQEGIEVVHNADQTAINYEYLPTKTLNGSGEKTVWVKCGGRSKERATAMVLGDSSGR
ncbi:hypothetical protein Ae201684P_019741 [Aphanomyces euteiches]|nr:hypothetical protein Ae201684P_019741 [Aphanomyces euteiches]